MTNQSSPEHNPPSSESSEWVLAGVVEVWSNNAWKVEGIISQPWFCDRQDVLASPEVMAKEVFKWIRRPAIRWVIEDMPDNLSIIRTANVILVDGEMEIEFSLLYEDWMSDRLLNAAVVIETWGDIDGKRQREIEYAGILSIEDTDASWDTINIKVCQLFKKIPLLNLWNKANPRKRHINGVITLKMIEGQFRVLLGLDVYLGEMMISPEK